ncbi:MAG TPA: putative oxidoreductase C-terminal domain-containing protein [Ohtaekwangia sp.]
MRRSAIIFGSIFIIVMACATKPETDSTRIRLITLDPGHFHAALIQKSMYDDIDSTVHVYAPAGNDLQLHLDRVKSFNTRSEGPTRWHEEVYTGDDFFEKMIAEKEGNVVVLSGNNQKKIDYIVKSLQNGFNVLADKPMVINHQDFEKLRDAFTVAGNQNLLLYDIMTERYEITTMLQRELSLMPDVFGELQKGTPELPAITKESVHHFYKYVSGSVLTRPAWFLDVNQQGEGIVDVMTHLVDLVQWGCFPEQVIDYKQDIAINKARRWFTELTQSEFRTITKTDGFPSYLKPAVAEDTILNVYCNGEINYTIKGVHAKTSVVWKYRAPDGTGDTHYSIMRGTKANLIIRQGIDEGYKPTLYIESVLQDSAYESKLTEQVQKLQEKFAGVEIKKSGNAWVVIIPEKYKEGHEAHFSRVAEKYLHYVKHGDMPSWEVPNMLAKYYTTTKALEVALQN